MERAAVSDASVASLAKYASLLNILPRAVPKPARISLRANPLPSPLKRQTSAWILAPAR